MNKVLGILLVLLLTATTAFSAEPKESDWFSGQLKCAGWSKLVMNGSGVELSEDPVLQTDLSFNLPYGFYLGSILTVGLGDNEWSSDNGDRLDYYFGWSRRFGHWQFKLEADYFDFKEIHKGTKGDAIYLISSLARQVEVGRHLITPFVYCGYLMPAKKSDPGGIIYDWDARAGFGHSCPVPWFDLSFSQKVMVICNHGGEKGKVKNAGFFQWEGSLLCQVGKGLTLNPIGVKFRQPLQGFPKEDGREGHTIWFAGIAYSF